ncbi:MAG: methyl-accepting chemotaxis protein [Leptospiraceae bacterium]|nr:methyl-accepting chemotaxis protein [Leptospiraceae bacterium]
MKLNFRKKVLIFVLTFGIALIISLTILVAYRTWTNSSHYLKELVSRINSQNRDSIRLFIEKNSLEMQVLAEVFSLNKPDRNKSNEILKTHLSQRSEILGAYIVSEPYKYDGRDNEYINYYGHDSTGRFIPYWVKNEKGEISLEASAGYEKENADNAFYFIPKKNLKPHISEPLFYEVKALNKKILMTSFSSPILNANKEFVGVIGVDMALAEIQKFVANIDSLGGFATLYSQKGVIIGSKKPEFIGKTIQETTSDEKLIQVVMAQKSEILERYSKSLDENVITSVLPIHFENTNVTWVVTTNIPKTIIAKEVNTTILFIVLFGIASLLIFAFLVYSFAGKILNFIEHIVVISSKIEKGKLITETNLSRDDELGAISKSILSISKNFASVIIQIQKNSKNIVGISKTIGDVSLSVLSSSKSNSTMTENISYSLQSMKQSFGLVAEKILTQNENIQRISSDVSALGGMVIEIQKQLKDSNNDIQKIVLNAKSGVDSLTVTNGKMEVIYKNSKEMQKIVGLIVGLSKQIHLLSLNAAIEAARAGEAGKGFAVVAEEVAKLASATDKSVSEIKNQIEENQLAADSGIQTTSESIRKVASITEQVSSLKTHFESIHDFLKSLVELNQSTIKEFNSISVLSREIQETSNHEKSSIDSIGNSIQAITTNIENNAHEIQALVGRISELKEISNSLNSSAAYFEI